MPGDSFRLLDRQRSSLAPSRTGSDFPDLQRLTLPHLDSFNAIFQPSDDGLSLLQRIVADLPHHQVTDQEGGVFSFKVASLDVARPTVTDRNLFAAKRSVFPSECRQAGLTYEGRLTAKLEWSITSPSGVRSASVSEVKNAGFLPLMVRSIKCHLNELSADALVRSHEESEEMGGYFIVNGIEKLVRLLIVSRRNYPIALKRPSLASRGPLYTHWGVQARCVRPDQTSQTLTLHYLSDGCLMVRFSHRKSEYLVPLVLILKALQLTTDRKIYTALIQQQHADTFLTGRVESMLRETRRTVSATTAADSQRASLEFLGRRFRPVLATSDVATDEQVGQTVLDRLIAVHLQSNASKFDFLVLMARKLYSTVQGKCCVDNSDSPMHHEILLPGHLILAAIKDRLGVAMETLRLQLAREKASEPNSMKKALQRANFDIGKSIANFLATGNLNSRSGLDLQQTTGYTVVAEKLNFLRYLSHFRSVHRGAFFAEMKTTTVRKLLPEAWGFLCPVHTPDGAPCGLLSHLSRTCVIPGASCPDKVRAEVRRLLLDASLFPLSVTEECEAGHLIPVTLDGEWLAMVTPEQALALASAVRRFRRDRAGAVAEVSFIAPSNGGTSPGLFVSTGAGRFMRPVLHCSSGQTDWIGAMEQVYENIAIYDTADTSFAYRELFPGALLSVVASFTPYSDFNQSPRNMYQCQMAKQTIGTPLHSLPYRSDNKLYHLHTGQAPIARNASSHLQYACDSYPNGANAVVAVLSYTGYDMEDAMILSKSAYERGFGHATVYKSEFYNLEAMKRRGEAISFRFHPSSTTESDGLPVVGRLLEPGDSIFSYQDQVSGAVIEERFHDFEPAYIDQVRLVGGADGTAECQKIHVRFRYPRNPVIGDKFSSRHGQKGVLSQHWPAVDMPWSESGIIPDVIINPHAFPSRMTIGMLLESMAAKAGALDGAAIDASPFSASDDQPIAESVGARLLKHGFAYYGSEPMYSGVTGCELRADIYLGIVYYQRLRHMVGDKFQVRTIGPVHDLTRQPIQGRKRAGGIRFGEMERDSLLAHGASFLLQDRLVNCSDYSQAYICTRCKSILSAAPTRPAWALQKMGNSPLVRPFVRCRTCISDEDESSTTSIDVIALPFVFRYLATELMAMNIRILLNTSS